MCVGEGFEVGFRGVAGVVFEGKRGRGWAGWGGDRQRNRQVETTL